MFSFIIYYSFSHIIAPDMLAILDKQFCTEEWYSLVSLIDFIRREVRIKLYIFLQFMLCILCYFFTFIYNYLFVTIVMIKVIIIKVINKM